MSRFKVLGNIEYIIMHVFIPKEQYVAFQEVDIAQGRDSTKTDFQFGVESRQEARKAIPRRPNKVT